MTSKLSITPAQLLLCKLKSIDIAEFAPISKYTKIKSTSCKPNKLDNTEFIIHTITVSTRIDKKTTLSEDEIYAKYPQILENISRGFSIVTTKDNPDVIITVLEGPRKFSGRSSIDEDLDDDNDADANTDSNNNDNLDNEKIYDHNEIVAWSQSNCLEITQTEKLNGKYASFRIFSHHDNKYIIYGSKNYHLIEPISEFERIYPLSQTTGFKTSGMSIVDSIKYSIARNIYSFLSTECISLFDSGYTLVGELCDGQHFVTGDGWIYWFGAFNNSKSMDINILLPLLSSLQIPTVTHKIVYDNSTNPAKLDSIFANAKCMNNEGCVLYCRNIETGKIVLVKTKAIQYIVKRFFRQKIIGGYRNMYHVIDRFIAAAKYHGLNTDASIRITKQLLTFGYWMMNNNYPGFLLNVIRDDRFKNRQQNGFAPYWDMYLSDMGSTENAEIHITLDDFADEHNKFDPEKYKNAIMSQLSYQHKTVADMPCVVFFQSIQGSGKSFIAYEMCDYLNTNSMNSSSSSGKDNDDDGLTAMMLEQDQYMGCTASTQGRLYHLIRYNKTYLFNTNTNTNTSTNTSTANIKYIFISRCNASYKQYAQYLNICHEVGAPVKFIEFGDCITPVGFMASIYNIIERSGGLHNINNLQLGYTHLCFVDIIKALHGNMDSFEPHKNAHSINLYSNSLATTAQYEIFANIVKTQFESLEGKKDNLYQYIYSFVNTDYENRLNLLKELRRNVTHIIEDIIKITNSPIKYVSPAHINYIGIFITEHSRIILNQMLHSVYHYGAFDNSSTYTKHIDHITVYHSSNGDKNILEELPAVYTQCKFDVDKLIIRKSDKLCCITVKNITDVNGNSVKTTNKYPHITLYTPSGVSPMTSNNIIRLSMEDSDSNEYICADITEFNDINNILIGVIAICGR